MGYIPLFPLRQGTMTTLTLREGLYKCPLPWRERVRVRGINEFNEKLIGGIK